MGKMSEYKPKASDLEKTEQAHSSERNPGDRQMAAQEILLVRVHMSLG